MILVVGATGVLGGEICRRLAIRGDHVRALVRPSSDPGRVRALERLVTEIAPGDLRDAPSLGTACAGVDAVITTASAVPHRFSAGRNDIATVDLEGTMRLIDTARDAGIGHFVYVSLSGNLDPPCPLRDAKRDVERRLRAAGMRYTVVRPSAVMEAWLAPAAGFDYPRAIATVDGAGDGPISWIALGDLAEFSVRSLAAPAAWSTTLELGGPEAVTPLEVVRTFERASGRRFAVTHVPEEALEGHEEAATDDMTRSIWALRRAGMRGDPIPMTGLLSAIPLALTSVSQYAERVLGKVPADALMTRTPRSGRGPVC